MCLHGTSTSPVEREKQFVALSQDHVRLSVSNAVEFPGAGFGQADQF